jgi:hypothetical protein
MACSARFVALNFEQMEAVMPVQVKSTREIQNECAEIATQLDTLTHRLHWAREALRLPPDAPDLWEDQVPWPVELEVATTISIVVDEDLDDAVERLRKAARVTAEMLRNRHRSDARQQKD